MRDKVANALRPHLLVIYLGFALVLAVWPFTGSPLAFIGGWVLVLGGVIGSGPPGGDDDDDD